MSELPSLQGHEMFETSGLNVVFDALEKAGGQGRIVGGAVRNAVLGEPVHDIDIATQLLPEQVIEAAKSSGLKAIETGIDHGTVTIVSENNSFEVTTLRRDVATDGRHATVAYTDDWARDAARRDFTLNSLYADRHGKVYDPLGGYGDLLARIIRFVGDPVSRISEDYLRILRYFRFFSQYGSETPDPEAMAACTSLRDGLNQLSRERIGQEMRKLLLANGAGHTAGLMNEAGVSKVLFGCDLDADLLSRVIAIDRANGLEADFHLRLAAGLPMDAERMGELLRLSRVDELTVAQLQDCLPPAPALRDNERRVVLYRTGVSTWRKVVRLEWARTDESHDDARWLGLLQLADEWQLPTLPVTGADVVAAGIAPGPQVGEILVALEDWWIAGGFMATKEELLLRIST